MKFKILTALLLASFTTYAQNNCQIFRTGKFQNINKGVVKSTIERNDSIQHEYFADKEIKLKITWIDNCTYKLKLIWGNDAFWNGRPKNLSTPDLIVRITKTNGNEYEQESRSEGDDFIYKSTLIKIE